MIKKYILQMLIWAAIKLIGGYPPGEKEAFRAWLLKIMDQRIFPLVQLTDTKIDDTILDIVRITVENDSAYTVAWSMILGQETITDVTQTETPGFLMSIRSRISRFRAAKIGGLGYSDCSTNKEAERVILTAAVLSPLINGPLAAFGNIQSLIDRINERDDND